MVDQFESETSGLSSLSLSVPGAKCQGKALGMVLTWDHLQSYQPKRFKQMCSRQAVEGGGDIRSGVGCAVRVTIS